MPVQPLAPMVRSMAKLWPAARSDPAICTDEAALKSAMVLVRICLAVRAASGLPRGAVEAGAPEVAGLAPQPAASTASIATAIATGLRGIRMGDKLQNEPRPGGPYR